MGIGGVGRCSYPIKRREHDFRKIGGKLAKLSTSATSTSEEIYLKEAAYRYYPLDPKPKMH